MIHNEQSRKVLQNLIQRVERTLQSEVSSYEKLRLAMLLPLLIEKCRQAEDNQNTSPQSGAKQRIRTEGLP